MATSRVRNESWEKYLRVEFPIVHTLKVDDFLNRAEECRVKNVASTFSTRISRKATDAEGKELDIVFLLSLNVNANFTLMLSFQSETEVPLTMSWVLGFQDKDKELREVTEGPRYSLIKKTELRYWKTGAAAAAWQPSGFITVDPAMLLPEGTLTVFCSMTVFLDSRIKGTSYEAIVENVNPAIMTGDFKFDLDQAHLSDVILECDGKRLNCHKIILASRSDVFADLFKPKKTEDKETNKVLEIADADPDVFELFIKYLYTNEVKMLDRYASELLELAERFNVSSLKTIASDALKTMMSVDNAAENLVLGFLHKEESLEKAAVELIVGNLKAVKDTEGWRKLSKTQPEIVNKVLMSIMER